VWFDGHCVTPEMSIRMSLMDLVFRWFRAATVGVCMLIQQLLPPRGEEPGLLRGSRLPMRGASYVAAGTNDVVFAGIGDPAVSFSSPLVISVFGPMSAWKVKYERHDN
jgi:hypothetical protein